MLKSSAKWQPQYVNCTYPFEFPVLHKFFHFSTKYFAIGVVQQQKTMIDRHFALEEEFGTWGRVQSETQVKQFRIHKT